MRTIKEGICTYYYFFIEKRQSNFIHVGESHTDLKPFKYCAITLLVHHREIAHKIILHMLTAGFYNIYEAEEGPTPYRPKYVSLSPTPFPDKIFSLM